MPVWRIDPTVVGKALPTFVGRTGLPDASRPQAIEAVAGRDFSTLLADPEKASLTAVQPAVLFNYVGPSTVDAYFFGANMEGLIFHRPIAPLSQAKLDKRGFLSFMFDGRHKFGRYYAPTAFETRRTLQEILGNTDVSAFRSTGRP
jgi:hypothetical protein